MTTETFLAPHPLPRWLRHAVGLTVVVNLVVGLAFLLGPELGITLWPTAIPPVLMRFIGAIIVANGVGAALIARRDSWEHARVLFVVALVYGALVLAALLDHLVLKGAPPLFWGYATLDALFLVPIAAITWRYERRVIQSRLDEPQAVSR